MTAVPSQSFDVWVGSDETHHRVRVRHVDRVFAERAAIPLTKPTGTTLADLPMGMVTAWCWAALKREGAYSGPLDRFINVDCLELEEVDDDDETEVPPTVQSPQPDSPSPSAGPTPGQPPTTG